jgi:hypothetical protein
LQALTTLSNLGLPAFIEPAAARIWDAFAQLPALTSRWACAGAAAFARREQASLRPESEQA